MGRSGRPLCSNVLGGAGSDVWLRSVPSFLVHQQAVCSVLGGDAYNATMLHRQTCARAHAHSSGGGRPALPEDDPGEQLGHARLVAAAEADEGQRHRRSPEIALLRQWFGAMLRRFDYMTLTVVGEGGGVSYQALQLLDLERKSLVVRPFVDTDEAAELQGLYTVSWQPLQRWGERIEATPCQSMTVFVFQEPAKVDIVTACGVSFESRRGILVWEANLSDVDGCVDLCRPTPLLARPVDLAGAQAPVLSLLDALGERGFVGVDEAVLSGVLQYDHRNICGRRAYLQCVLHMAKLTEKGITEFRSIGSAAYFVALLHGRSKVRPGLSAGDYRRQLAAERGDELALAALAVSEQATRRRGRAKAKALLQPPEAPLAIALAPQDGGSDGESVFGGSDQGAAAADRPAVGGEASAAHPPEVGQEAAIPPTGIPADILGQIVTFIPGRASATHSYAERISVTCSNPAHRKCSKSRSMAMFRDKRGVRCAEAFLGAWLANASSMGSPAHGKYTPTLAEMEEYLRTAG